MSESNELKKIKKLYGENFMHLCRELFPTILEKEGRLLEILSSCFSGNSRTLYEDINDNLLEEEFKNYIYSKIDVETANQEIIKRKTPYELLDEAGYDLIECTSEEEIQGFKKYYKSGEELCTFRGGRLDRCVVFFAVKKDVQNIKREDFKIPRREDEYGTSVMGIQFSKAGSCTVSIKNRYNHKVNNPDATYGNDLDRIIPGLTESFEEVLKQRGLTLNDSNVQQFEMPKYLKASDGKYYKYNMEINGNYYCPGNIIIEGGKIHKLDPEKQILIDYFILDKEKKTIRMYDPRTLDCFEELLGCVEKIEVTKSVDKDIRIITVQSKDKGLPIVIKVGNDNQMVGYENSNATRVGSKFLCRNKGLTQIDLPEVTDVGNDFLCYNKGLTQIDLPQVTSVGNNFLCYNEGLTQIELPQITNIENDFLCSNQGLTQLELPKVTNIGKNFLCYNKSLTQLELPRAISVGDEFLYANRSLIQIDLPEVTNIGNYFLYNNEDLIQMELPKEKKFKSARDEKRLLEIVEKNKKKKISAQNIAELDKESNLTTEETNKVRGIFERIINKVKKEIKEKNDDGI